MPIDPDVVEDVAFMVAHLYREAETALVLQISRRLEVGLGESHWAVRRLGEVRALRRAAELIVDQLERESVSALRQGLAEAWRSGNASALVDLAERHVGDVGPAARGAFTDAPGDRGDRPLRRAGATALQALADAAVRELRPVHAAILPQVERAYRQAISNATARHLAGAQDRRRAAQDAWGELVRQGITRFQDSGGRKWRLHTYVEMATRTAAARAATQGLIDGYEAGGQREVYVTDTPGECALCRPWEHQVLVLWGKPEQPAIATLDQARAAGLMHPNCFHSIAPWHPGIRLSRRTADPNLATARERQRALERHIRAWREREAAGLDEQSRQYAAARVRAWTQQLEQHLAVWPRLQRLRYREEIGAGHIAASARRTPW